MNQNQNYSAERVALGVLETAIYFAWGIGALIIWILQKLLFISPEKKLQKMKGAPQNHHTLCQHCGNYNTSTAPYCQSCGGRVS